MFVKDKKKLPKSLGPFEFWGVEFNDSAGDEFIATCPFCLHNDTSTGQGHFYVSGKTGAFDCKSCGKQGGYKNFIGFIHQKYLSITLESQIQTLANLRGIPRIALEGWDIAFAPPNRYLIPVYNSENKIVDLRVYRKGKNEIATKGCGTELLGIKRLKNKKTETIYICAGSFDCIYLDWLLKRTNKKGITVAVPGENTWKDSWIEHFEKRDAIVCYDNDEGGYGELDEQTGKSKGSLKVYSRLNNVASSIQFICWPEGLKKGYDVSDFINEHRKNNISPKKIFNNFQKLIKFQHKFHKIKNKAFPNGKPREIVKTWDILREKYIELFSLNDNFETAIKLSLATVLSIQLSGDCPVWLLLVGPGGEGKSVIIESTEASLSVLWESSLSSKSLVSGWGLGDSKRADPSILARINNKCLALKDYTEILEKNETEKNEIFSILRGAYDGRLKRPFGIGLRQYDCNFSFLAGVTNKIEAYSQGSVGERFLRYNIHPVTKNEDKQAAALRMQYIKDEKMPLLQDAVSSFLDQDFAVKPEQCLALLPSWWNDRIKPLGNLIEWLRTEVEREKFGVRKDCVIYEPIPGSGNRPSIQLSKIGTALCLLEGKSLIDESIYSIVKQVAIDSVKSYITNIAWSIISHKDGITKDKLSEIHHVRFIENYIDDLRLIGLIQYNTKHDLCVPTKKAHDLYLRAKLNVS